MASLIFNLALTCTLLMFIICGTESFLVDGATDQSVCSCGPRTCFDVRSSNPRPVVTLFSGMEVVCDTVTDEGGWVVIQRRASADVDFYRDWKSYKYGFGDVHGNFWMGLEKIHQLSFNRRYELRVDLEYNSTDYYAHYDSFALLGEPENYILQISGYSGTAGDSLAVHNGYPFTTKDKDHDTASLNCAQQYHGAWWYAACHHSNLNGEWGNKAYAQGIDWLALSTHYDTLTFTEMKIRPLLG